MKRLYKAIAATAALVVFSLGFTACTSQFTEELVEEKTIAEEKIEQETETCIITIFPKEDRSVITSTYKITDVTSWTLTAKNTTETYTATNADYTKLALKVIKDGTYTFDLSGLVKTGSTEGSVTGTIQDKKITEDTSLAFTVKPGLATDKSNPNAKGVAEIVFEEITKLASITESTVTDIAKIKGLSGNAAGKQYNPTFTISGNKVSCSEEIPTGIYSVLLIIDGREFLEKTFAVESGLKTTVPYTQNDVANCSLTARGLEHNYITFESSSSFKLSAERKAWTGTMEYSTDTITWETWDSSEKAAVLIGSKYSLFLRGNNTSLYDGRIANGNTNFKLESSELVDCYGNIMTLMNYSNSESVSVFDFSRLFMDCTKLKTAPALPATTLTMNCYERMFQGCTSLEIAPALPATNLTQECYHNMFYKCASLKTAPALPASSLAINCYQSMFEECTSLEIAPAISATNLAEYCCWDMFKGCTALKTAPALPATSLAGYCYLSMFKGCTALKTAPELSVTTLVYGCYYSMFEDCTSLETAPALPATSLAEYCYRSMFKGCTSLKSAPALPATSLAKCCYLSMFKGCTAIKSAPELSVTTLVYGCYYSMFEDCTSLETAPALPATSLANSCYYNMFKGCSSLKIRDSSGTEIFTVPTTDGLTNPVTDMFTNTGGTFTGTPTAGNTYYYY